MKPSSELNASFIIRHVAQTRDGKIWVGTDNGLFEIDGQNFHVTSFYHNEADAYSLPDNAVTYIFESSNGMMWLATGKGLSSFDRTSNHFVLHPLLALSNYFSIAAIREDHSQNLWISSNQGLFKYQQSSGQTNHYTVKNGLCTNRFIATAASTSTDGLLFFGGEKRVYLV
jgi:ligand-binding sensor domain-containing protein